MKKTAIILSILGGLLLVLLVIIAALPGIISSDMMKPRIMQLVNQQIPGQVRVKAWSLSWFSEIEIKEIVYDNRQDNLLARIAEINTSNGLLDLALGGGNLGAIEIIDPALVLYDSEKSGIQQTKDKSRPARTPQATEPKSEKDRKTELPAIYGKLKITNGSLYSAKVNGDEKLIAENLNAVLYTPGPQDPITYQFSVNSGDSSGKATGDGTLTLAADDPVDIKRIYSDSRLSIDDWELEDVIAMIASSAPIPAAKGRLNANLKLTGSIAESLNLASELSIPTLQLVGGPLGSDTPEVNGISIKIDGSGDSGVMSLKKLTFASSLADGSAEGAADPRGNYRLSGNVEIDLAAVFTQLPATLKLQKGTRITQGMMNLAAEVDTSGGSTTFAGNAHIDQIKGVNNNKKVFWDQPVTLNAKGDMGPDGLQLEKLSLRSAFMNADGQGNLSNMNVKLAADIKTALKEIKKFIEIKQWDGGGNLTLNLDLKAKTEKVSHATFNLDVKNLDLRHNKEPILPRQNVVARITTDINIEDTPKNSKLMHPDARINSSLATANFTASSASWNASSGFPDASGIKLDANLSFQQLSSLLRNLKILTPQTFLEGQSEIQSISTLKDGILALNSMTADTKKLVYRNDKQTIRENRLSLSTRGTINLNTRSIFLAPVDIKGQTGTVRIPELQIADWADAQKDMKTQVNANLDLARLARAYGDFIQLPAETKISGTGKFDVDLDFSNPKVQYLKVRGDVSPFKLASKTLPEISEKKITLDADLQRSPDGKHLTIDNLNLNSNALKLTAEGTLDQSGPNKVFEANGTMAPDLKLVSAYMKKTAGTPIQIAGQKATPFAIKLVSKGDRWEDPLKHLSFSGALHIDSVKAYGLSLTPNDVPIRLANASANARLDSPANGGTLAMQPIVDMRKEPYTLLFKKNIDVLKEVKVTRGLVDGLLAVLHPLFKNAVMPEGILGLHLKNFKWPLSEEGKNKASFAGTLHLDGIRLKSTPFLARLLKMMGIKEEEITITDQNIDFKARKGRVKTSPLTLDMGEYQLKVHGSFGFDESLNFIARVPVTRKMVGKDAYKLLKGTTIKVPIRGSVSNPKINRTALEDATGDLMQQALQKNVEQGVQDLFNNLLKKRD
jgi:translocation and assembly module TamB